jgi:hypothetical protein
MYELQELLKDIFLIYELSYLNIFYNKVNMYTQIIESNNKIKEIYNKYKVNNIDELIRLVDNYELSKIIYDKTLMQLIVFLIIDSNKKKDIIHNDDAFKRIYKYIIEHNLYDPNWSIGSSNEPLFTMLPNVSDLYNTNLLVFNNDLIDWNILNNGTDSFITFVYLYLNSNSKEEELYYLKIIKSAINRIDINSTKRYKSSQRKLCYEINSIKETITRIDNEDNRLTPILELIL